VQTECLIDVANNGFDVAWGYESKRLIIHFILTGEEQKQFNLKNLSFGYRLEKEGREVIENSWPMKPLKFGVFTPGTITSADIDLTIDTDYSLVVWCQYGEYEASQVKKFNTGKPFRAYDSMVWNEETEEWDMLKPYPEDATEPMFWNEEKLDWEIFDPEKDV